MEQPIVDLLVQWHHLHPILMPVGESIVGLLGLRFVVWPVARQLTDFGFRVFERGTPAQNTVHIEQLRRIALQEVLRQTTPLQTPVPEESRPKKKEEPPQNQTAADIYIEWCMQRLKDDTNHEAHVIGEKVEQLRTDERILLDLARQNAECKRLLEIVLKRQQDLFAESAERFVRCADRSEVARIEITPYGWCIVTTPLKMESETGVIRQLGKLEIHLDSLGKIRIYNQTRRVSQEKYHYDHPCVCDGVPFFSGTTMAAITEAVITHNLEMVLDVLLPCLTRVTDHPFVAITEWPEVPKDVIRLARQI